METITARSERCSHLYRNIGMLTIRLFDNDNHDDCGNGGGGDGGNRSLSAFLVREHS